MGFFFVGVGYGCLCERERARECLIRTLEIGESSFKTKKNSATDRNIQEVDANEGIQQEIQ